MSLNIADSMASGAQMYLYTYSDATDERFEFIGYDSSIGNYHINSTNGLYLDIEGKQAADSQNIVVYTPDDTNSQKWKIERGE